MLCEKCGVEHKGNYGSGRFCSCKCARSFSTSRDRKSINVRVSTTQSRPEGYECKKCDLWFRRKMQYMAHCRIHYRTFEDLKSDSSRRKWLIRERGHRCEICFNTEWNNVKIPIELDHISGDADDNGRSNLRLVCPNCHALTPTYKNKNQASKSRKERYVKNIKYAPVPDQTSNLENRNRIDAGSNPAGGTILT